MILYLATKMQEQERRRGPGKEASSTNEAATSKTGTYQRVKGRLPQLDGYKSARVAVFSVSTCLNF